MQIIQKFAVLVLMLLPDFLMAQNHQHPTRSIYPNYLPKKGHWVMESNINNRSHTIVSFYLDDNKLIAKEEINDMVLDIKNMKTKLWLKSRLDEVITEHELRSGIGLVD